MKKFTLFLFAFIVMTMTAVAQSDTPAYDWTGEYTVNATITPSVDLPATMTVVYSETEERTYVESIFGYNLRVVVMQNTQAYPTLQIAEDGKSATVNLTTGLYLAFENTDDGGMKWSLLKAKDGSSTITLTVDENGVVSIPDLQVQNVEMDADYNQTSTSFDITGITATKPGGAVEPGEPEVVSNPITALEQLSNTSVYTILPANNATCGAFCANANDLSQLYITYFSGATVDPSDAYQQFAILSSKGKYFLYNVGAAKFVAKNAGFTSLTETVSAANEFTFEVSNATPDNGHSYVQADYPWCVVFGGVPLCSTNSADWRARGGALLNWDSNGDSGTVVAITEVGTDVASLADALAIVEDYTICEGTVSSSDESMGTATVETVDNVATFTATPAEGYVFVNWTNGTKVVSTENPYTVELNDDLALVANFEEKSNEPIASTEALEALKASIDEAVGLLATAEFTLNDVETAIDLASNADKMLYSNAPCTDTSWGDEFKSWAVLFDDNTETIFHSEYKNGATSLDGNEHYIRVDLGDDALSRFSFTFTTRNKNCDVNSPTEMVVEGCNEENGEYTEIATINDIPQQNSYKYVSNVFTTAEAYRYIRFRVTKTGKMQTDSGDKVFFFISEFGLNKVAAVPSVADAYTSIINDLTALNTAKVAAETLHSAASPFAAEVEAASVALSSAIETVKNALPEEPKGIDFDKTYKVKFDASRLSIKDETYSNYLPTEWDITFQYSEGAEKYFIKDFLGANLIDMNYGYTTYVVNENNPYQFDIIIEEGYNTLFMLDDTYSNYLILCNKEGGQSGSITVTVDDEGNATVGDFSVYYLKANMDNGATEELKLVAVYGEDEVVEPAGPEVVFEMTAGQIGTVPQILSDEDAAKIFDLSTLTIAVKVTTPATMSGRQALLCTSDPTANANTDAMPTGSAYVGYGFNNADIGYLASCKDGDRYTTKSGITGGTDNVLVYVLNPDGNNFKSYVNGNVIQNRDFGGYEIATPKMVKEDHSNACIYIGGGMTAEGAREAYTGTIKGIKIFNGELTAEEIANIVFPEEPEAASYTVTANVAPVSDWGTVTIEGYEGTEASIEEGTEVTLTATPAEGYEFDSWTDIAGNELSKEASYKFTVTTDVTVIAYFAEKAVGAEYFSIEKVSPDEGVVTELRQIHLIPTVSSLYDLPTGWTITDANNNSYEVSIEWGMNPWYDVLVRLKEPITAPGTYTLTIPEGSAQDDYGKIISAATYSWTIEETATGINGIDAENGETVIFDITGRKIEAITAPGIYIVNGKKVLVK